MLTESKRLDVLIKKFNKMPEKKLKIIWEGHLKDKLLKLKQSTNIEFCGYKSWEELLKLVWESKWGIFCGVEDFWIAAIELISAWKAIFCLNKWWYKDTNLAWITWEFYNDEEWSDFIEKFKKFEENIDSNKYKKEILQSHASKFSKEKFKKELEGII
jgi:hypothetical protein